MSMYEIIRVGVRYQLIERASFRSLRRARSYMFKRIVTLTNDEMDGLLSVDDGCPDPATMFRGLGLSALMPRIHNVRGRNRGLSDARDRGEVPCRPTRSRGTVGRNSDG